MSREKTKLSLAFHSGQNYQVYARTVDDLAPLLSAGFTIHYQLNNIGEYGRAATLEELRTMEEHIRHATDYKDRIYFPAPYILYNGELAGVIVNPMSNDNGPYGNFMIGLNWQDGDFVKLLPASALRLIDIVKRAEVGNVTAAN